MKRSGPPERRSQLARGPGPKRKTGLARGGALKASSGLSRGPGPERQTQIRQVSRNQGKRRTARAALVGELVAAGVRCEIGPELAHHGFAHRCAVTIGGIHERRKRSGSGSLTAAANLIPACNACNGWIEDWLPTIADELPAELVAWLVIRPGDPEWEATGGRTADETVALTIRLCKTCGQAHVTVPPSGILPCGHRAV